MMRSIHLLPLVFLTSGCWMAAIPRHSEIKRPVTMAEIAGVWVLNRSSLTQLQADRFSPTNQERFFIVIHNDGTYYAHRPDRSSGLPVSVSRIDSSGVLSLSYNSTNIFRNRLTLGLQEFWIGKDGEKMIIWQSWGDPDEGVDMVYEESSSQTEATAM